MKVPLDVRLADADAERVRRSHVEVFRELQAIPSRSVIRNVVIADNTIVTVAHRLGRAPAHVSISVLRFPAGATVNPGVTVDMGARDVAGLPINRTEVVQLGAFSYGTTITVDVEFS